MGQSERQKSLQDVQSQYKGLYSQTQATPNRFENFQYQFGYPQQFNALQQLTGQNAANINRVAGNQLAGVAGGTAGRLASQGITGGSIQNQAIAQGQTPIAQGQLNALQQLYSDMLGQNIGLQNAANQRQFGLTQAQQATDFQKLGALASLLGQGTGIAGAQNPNTWIDDLYAAINTGGNIAKAVSLFV